MITSIGLSTACIYPDSVQATFGLAAELELGGVEIMVESSQASRSAHILKDLIQKFQVPVTAIHSPCLMMALPIWTPDPIVKLQRSIMLAEAVGASTVVTHPPFVFQRLGRTFRQTVAHMQDATAVQIAVENEFSQLVMNRPISMYRPHWDPTATGYRYYTLDLSHTSAAGVDAVAMASRMTRGLVHIHLADGTDTQGLDAHLVPGRGTAPIPQILAIAKEATQPISVVLEINTRQMDKMGRLAAVHESVQFMRDNIVR